MNRANISDGMESGCSRTEAAYAADDVGRQFPSMDTAVHNYGSGQRLPINKSVASVLPLF